MRLGGRWLSNKVMYADYNKTRGTMGLIEKELEKVSLYDFFNLELDITVYQRPYT